MSVQSQPSFKPHAISPADPGASGPVVSTGDGDAAWSPWVWRRTVFVLLLYGAAAVVMTWPLLRELGAQIPADQGTDFRVHEWTFYWLRRALEEQRNPYFTPLLFHPTGVALTSHNIAWINFGFWYPLQTVFGADAAYSLAFLLLFPLNGFAMYLFALSRIRMWTAAVIAGLVFAFSPFVLTQAGHPNMLTLAWLPLALIYLARTLRRARRTDAARLGLFIALLGLSRWQLLIPAAVILLPFGLYCWFSDPHAPPAPVLRRLLLAGALALLLTAPLLAPVVIAQLTRDFAGDLLIYEPAFSTDLARYVVPVRGLPLAAAVRALLPADLHFTQEEIPFLGFTVLTLSLIGVATRLRRTLFWLGLALLLIVLAAGPVVTVAGRELVGVPTLYGVIDDWFVTRLLRKPERYNIVLGLPVGMLAAYGLAALTGRLSRPWTVAVAVLPALMILAEARLDPYPLAPPAIPGWYAALPVDAEGAIAEFPIGSRLADKIYMHYQTRHGRPILGGHVSRPPRESIAYMDASPMLDDMLFRRELTMAQTDVSRQLRYLADAGFDHLVLNKGLATGEQIESWRRWLAVQPRYEDQEVVVFTTQPRVGTDLRVTHAPADGIAIGPVEITRTSVRQGDLVGVNLVWGATGNPAADYVVCLQLIAAGGATAQTACDPISQELPTGRWETDEIVRGAYPLRIDPFIPPGAYTLGLTLRTAGSDEDIRPPHPLETLTVEALPRRFAAPAVGSPVDARFGEAIGLLGYDLAVDEHVEITLYWRALTPPRDAYKVFVQLADAATGAMMAQHDAEPRTWSYPTSWWAAGEIVDETIVLIPDTAALPPAAVLRIGLYDGQSGIRLPLHLPAGTADARVEDNALIIDLSQSRDP